MKEAGVDPVSNISIETRIEAQEKLLAAYCQEISQYKSWFITDRTPLDMIGYTLGEVSMHNTSAELGDRIDVYVKACVEATKRNFLGLLVLRPLPHYEVADGKPPLNLAYQTHLQFIVEGAVLRTGLTHGRVASTDFETRLAFGERFFNQIADLVASTRKDQELH